MVQLGTREVRRAIRGHFRDRGVLDMAVDLANRVWFSMTAVEESACLVIAMKYLEDEPMSLYSLFPADVVPNIPAAERAVLAALDYVVEPRRQKRPCTPTPFDI
jgi:hypothetical protein